ncbi:MAG: TolC family protein [Parachlamydiales bacterium]|jgi:NodT family efflux transporter outer membrane factor (OMF) lipoprotein
MKAKSIFLLIVTNLLTVGCFTVTPRALPYEIPYPAVENEISAAAEDPIFEPKDWISEDWWVIFQDSQLDCLMAKALENNPSMQAAKARILAASYNVDGLAAALYPNITQGSSIQREKLSKTGVIPAGNSGTSITPSINPATGQPGIPIPSSGGIPFYYTLYQSAFNFLYDFDLWDKNKNAVKAAVGQYNASVADEALARLVLSISVAQAYFQLQIDYKRQGIAKERVLNRERYLHINGRRLQQNLESMITFHEAENLLAVAKQNLIKIEADIEISKHLLKALIAGEFDDEFSPVALPIPKVPLPAQIPLHLISHRPDITTQLWLIESAGYQIEIAKVSYLPDVNIMGLYGLQTIHFRKFFEALSTFGFIGPTYTLPVYDGGLLQSQFDSAEVNYDLAIYDYNNLILTAVREVLDSLSLLTSAHKQYVVFEEETAYQDKILHLTELRKKNGLNSELDVLTRKETWLSSQDSQMVALGDTFQAILSLIKSLGGGYDVCPCTEVN